MIYIIRYIELGYKEMTAYIEVNIFPSAFITPILGTPEFGLRLVGTWSTIFES